MHELSLLENVREILETHAKQESFTKVTRITLQVGKLSSVEPDALRFGFDVVMRNSLAEGAELNISELDGLGQCRDCGQTFQLETLYATCLFCNGSSVDVVQGMDMKIKDLLVF